MGLRRIVVFDTNHGFKNRFFKRDMVGENRFLWPWCFLYELCRERGIELMSGDVYLEMENKPKSAFLFARDMITKNTYKFIKMGLRPIVLYALENPLYACDFYFNLQKYVNYFENVFTFRSLRDSVYPKKKFNQAFYPIPYGAGDICGSFKNRKFLTMISGNHVIHPLRRLYVRIFQKIKPIPTLVNRDLYLDRLMALEYFSKYDDFDLWGRDWNKSVKYFRKYGQFIKKSYRGITEDKFETLKSYKFSICFENCIMGGWITEKIFDTMVAGSIPIYWGAPDVTDYIPKNCFIDFRDFKNFNELDQYLKNVDEKTYYKYIQNIKDFFASEMYLKNFGEKVFAERFINLFESYF